MTALTANDNAISSIPHHDIKSDLVQVITRDGRKIMIQRQTAIAIEESWRAIDHLTETVNLQREAFERQNQDVETMNDTMKRNVQEQNSGVKVTVLRGIDNIIKGIVVAFFFCKTQLVAASVFFRQLPMMLAQKWTDSPQIVKIGIICAVSLALGAIVVTALV